MCQARTWAMYTLNSWENVEIVLDAGDIDESSKWFLTQDIPQYNGGVKLAYWRGSRKDKGLVSFVNGDKIDKTLYVWHFTDDSFPSSLYVSMYDTTGKIFAPTCLYKTIQMQRSVLPSDRRMEVVSGALFKLAKATNDVDAYFYHQHITLVDLILEQLTASTGRLLEVVA